MTRRILPLLGIIVLASGVLGSLMLTRGHSWGDDFAGYIMQAQSILDGRLSEYVERSAFVVSASHAQLGPVTYPWGFPLLLAPILAVFGLKMLALKLVATIFYMGFLLVFFHLARALIDDRAALLLTAVMAFSVEMLEAQDQILSDIPFLFLSTLGLWQIARLARQQPGSRRSVIGGAAIGLIACAAAITRMNGILLLLPLAAAQALQLRGAREEAGRSRHTPVYWGIPYLVFALAFALQAIAFPSSGEGLLRHFTGVSPETIERNLGYYFWLPSAILPTAYGAAKTVYVVLLMFFLLGSVRSSRTGWPMLIYLLATIGLYVVFPPTQGLRYLYPVLPIFLIFAFQGLQLGAQMVMRPYRPAALALISVIWMVLAVFSLTEAIAAAETNLSRGRIVQGGWQAGPYSPASQAMMAFIRESTPAESVVVFFKPRAMRLFTNRDSYIASSCNELITGNYVVLVNDNDLAYQIPPDEISQCEGILGMSLAYHQQGFRVYEVDLGP